jgi:hypothetical protein
MPEKSTYFFPKLLTGLVFYPLDEPDGTPARWRSRAEAVRAGHGGARATSRPARSRPSSSWRSCLEKPLLVEGPAGAGKTELAKVVAPMLATDVIRLQCYEGPRRRARALRVELPEAADAAAGRSRGVGVGRAQDHIFSRDYLLERPLLRAISAPRRRGLLIDEVDKADEELEAFCSRCSPSIR